MPTGAAAAAAAAKSRASVNPEVSNREELKKFKKLAEDGNAGAQCYLGIIYRQGLLGCAPQDELAVKWYLRAAQGGHAGAQCHLAMMYKTGRGCQQSDIEAVKWFTKAADRGEANAQYYLGRMYAAGKGVHGGKSYERAAELFEIAAKAGHAAAVRDLGTVYRDGLAGRGQDLHEAFKLYTKAVKMGDPPAKKLAQLLEKDHPEVLTPPGAGKRWPSLEDVIAMSPRKSLTKDEKAAARAQRDEAAIQAEVLGAMGADQKASSKWTKGDGSKF